MAWLGVMPALGAELVIEESSHADQVFLPVGERLVVRLSGNPTTGYSWEVAGGAGRVAGLEGKVGYQPDPAPQGKVGSGGTFTAAFKVLSLLAEDDNLTQEMVRPKGSVAFLGSEFEVVARPHHLYRYRAEKPGDDEVRVRYRFNGGKRGAVAKIAKDFRVLVRVYQP